MTRRLLALVAAAIVGCGAPAKTAEAPEKRAENTMWYNCYDEFGQPDMAENILDKRCPEAAVIDWGELPVRVYAEDEVKLEPLMEAFQIWEQWLGQPVFKLVAHPDEAQVGVGVGDQLLEDFGCGGAAACAPHMRLDDGTLQAWVIFSPQYQTAEIGAHEFGHTLGLAHDHGLRRSVMYPSLGWYMPWLQAADRRALCELYGC